MLNNFLRKFSLLMMSLLLVSCASQESVKPFNAPDVNSESNPGQSTQKVDNLKTGKPIAGPLSQPVEVEKEVRPVKETGSASAPTSGSKSDPLPESVFITLNVQFDTGKAAIEPKYHDDIKIVADIMSKYPSTVAVIEGHTDDVGKEMVNVKLSYQRADNIRAYLAETFGIARSRIKVIGYDYQKPIASNETSEGRQKNRRAETHIEAKTILNKLYSFSEESDLPIGGFSIVNQETIDAKIKSFMEKQGAAAYSSNIVNGPTLELYAMWSGIFSHCAIRIETKPHSFYQLELQTLPDLEKAGLKNFNKIGATINLLGVTEEQFDLVEFTDKDERSKLDKSEPHYATMPICIDPKATRKSPQWYKDCLSRLAKSYNYENSLKAGNRPKVFDYNPIIHNCCNFAEDALEACGLAHCFDLGKSTGLNSKTGLLEE
jgi:outer membrane protein OmpA-like peptidoglycan-associated protein